MVIGKYMATGKSRNHSAHSRHVQQFL